jgi:hypothetical protein
MDKEAVLNLLKEVYWDRKVDKECLYNVLNKKQDEYEGITLAHIYSRLLQSYSWYTIIDIIGASRISDILAEEMLANIWNKDLRAKYQNAKRILYP